jgi:hypothetical protein
LAGSAGEARGSAGQTLVVVDGGQSVT